MVSTHKYSVATFDAEKIPEINKVILKYSENITRSSAHVLFDIEPVNLTDVVEDLTFFRITSENEAGLKNKYYSMVEELNQVDTDYSIRNEDTGEFHTTIATIGALDIKFDKISIIKKGTYQKIDELKNIKTEYGYCKGYKPHFRLVEDRPIESVDVPKEIIYLFADSSENFSKLKEEISGKVLKIEPDFELEMRIFIDKDKLST